MKRDFLHSIRYLITNPKDNVIGLPVRLVSTERERALHLGEISLNYINSARIVVVRQNEKQQGGILHLFKKLRAKITGLRYLKFLSVN